MTEHALGDATRQGAPYATQPAAPHDDQVYLQLIGESHDLLGHRSRPEVGLGYGPAGDLHPPDQLPERLLALCLDRLVQLVVVAWRTTPRF